MNRESATISKSKIIYYTSPNIFEGVKITIFSRTTRIRRRVWSISRNERRWSDRRDRIDLEKGREKFVIKIATRLSKRDEALANLNDLMDASLIIHEGKRGRKGEINRAESAISFLRGVRNVLDSGPAGWNDALTFLRTLSNIPKLSRLILDSLLAKWTRDSRRCSSRINLVLRFRRAGVVRWSLCLPTISIKSTVRERSNFARCYFSSQALRNKLLAISISRYLPYHLV